VGVVAAGWERPPPRYPSHQVASLNLHRRCLEAQQAAAAEIAGKFAALASDALQVPELAHAAGK
jgi:hypothetical protein